ncbi:MAG: sigma-70 family RNA polymerase sigma factor [Planctomycetota bacterium]
MNPSPAPSNSRSPQEFLRGALAEHGRWLRTVLAARGVDAGELDDVFQEVARQAVENVDRLRDRQRVAPWLYRIAATTALEHRRKAGRRRRREHEVAERQGEQETSDPLDWLLRRERESLVRQAVAKLPGRDAEVLMLKHAEGWSYRQLAEHLGIGEGAVQSRLHRARERLRAELARHGVTSTV